MIRGAFLVALAVLLATSGCTREKRVLDPAQPMTDLIGATDPRLAQYLGNRFQIAQGGRVFLWEGCGACHDDQKARSKGFADLYHAVLHHGAPTSRLTIEQRWQVCAYLAQLPAFDPAARRRQDLDQQGEARGNNWSGPVT